ncbi:MAG: ribonuclease PH [Chloroflexota bacterium]|jgi:ribonuclease PH|nr:ribonuclease PH [Chloroflexota bacterium]
MQAHRSNSRSHESLRNVTISVDVNKHAEGSAIVEFGDTKVLCTATVEKGVPRWKRGDNSGWLTAEYAMLPRSTNTRSKRGQNGRATEIQRLIGRSLRTSIDLAKVGEETITLDCDVLQADGGTRTASITGAWVALSMAVERLQAGSEFPINPITAQVAAISCGMVDGELMLDLDYREDSNADVDFNVVMLSTGKLVEIQGTAEQTAFSKSELTKMLNLAEKGIATLFEEQRKALAEWKSG